ncbi:hypothetical protein JAAARDRAFT_191603 [Jaapia argillacea MUCL 33604]|uniref:Uncharacterized protein n=1 Tax=Jaapia argillacea MUCL 33604 TaxID=933084 RepID=A0A067PZE9_9AGAM|nr:hypothetical protein JAAARDRAFT_191603 [Jaapia argillacea MUCL 33604]
MPLQVRARKVVTLGSRVCNEPLAIVIFVLSNLPIHGSPYDAALLQLQNYYADNDTLVAHEIVFNLSVDGALAAHTHKVDQVVVELKRAGIKRAIVMIMTHANNADGLPFFEPAGCCTFKEFFAGVIQDHFITLTKTWDTTWFMLTCGPMMTAGTSLVELVKEANSLEIQRIIGVGIAGFFPCMLNPFMMTFVEKFLIEGETFDKVMPKIVTVRARKVVTLGSRICNEPLAVVVFALSNIPIRGSPYNAALLQLQNYYADNDILVTREIVFDLSVDGALAAHTRKVDQVVAELKQAGIKRAIVMIMTHANDANGLPFFEPAGCCTFKEFFAGVIQDHFITLTKTWDTTWFMLTCGPMMTAGTSLVELVKEANSLEIQRIIGVGIAGFFPCMLNPFMMTFVEKFLIEGETFDKVMPKIVTGLTATLTHIPIYVISPPPPREPRAIRRLKDHFCRLLTQSNHLPD